MTENVALTPEEQRRLKPLFEKYDLEDSSIVLGDRIRPLLEQSGLPPLQLGQIWQIVDTENRGFLDFQAFSKCMRLIAHAQQGLQISPRLANIPSGSPDFNRQPAPAVHPSGSAAAVDKDMSAVPAAVPASLGSPQATGTFSASPAALTTNFTGGVPPLTKPDKSRFGTLFDRSIPPNSPDSQFIEGSVAREIFLKARLPEETLGQIWALVDTDGRGKLTKNEFVVAMHLIQAKLTGALPTLPAVMPPSWQPWLGSPTGHARQGSIQAQSTPAHAAHAAPAAPAAAPAAAAGQKQASTVINPQERQQYDAIFDSLDPQKHGILGPQEAVPVLTKSGLSEDVLAKVWDLADTRSRGQLDKGDFALAMHFIKAKLNGMELPDTVSPGAGAPNAQRQQPQQQQQQQQQPQQQQPQQHAAPPQPKQLQHAATTIGVSSPQPQSVQRGATSSLSDLVSLDNAVFTPLEPQKPKRAQTETDERKFVPTTSFGQQLLKSQQSKDAPNSPAVAAGAPPAISSPTPQSHVSAAAQAPAAAPPAAGAGAAAFFQPGAATGSSPAAPSEAEITAQKAAAARANEELAAILKRKAEHEQHVRELRATYDAEAKSVHQTQQQVKQEQEAVKQLERDLALRTSGLDAMRTQRQSEQSELDALRAQKAELEEKIRAAEAEHAEHATAAESFTNEKESHLRAIEQHKARVTTLTSDIEAIRLRHQELETETRQHSEHLAQVQRETEEHTNAYEEATKAARDAEAELVKQRELKEKAILETERLLQERAKAEAAAEAVAAEAAKAAADARAAELRAAELRAAELRAAELRAAETRAEERPSSSGTSSKAISPAAVAPVAGATSVSGTPAPHLSVPGAQAVAVAGADPMELAAAERAHNSSQLPGPLAESIQGSSTPATQLSEQSEPYLSRDNSMPSFVLPMQRPASVSSSVINNPPQSVRGDLGSEASEPRDGSEFVDAQDHPSSDDDEGPQEAIPRKYSEASNRSVPPPMPGAFPTTGEPVNPISEQKIDATDNKSTTPYSDRDASQPTPAVKNVPNVSGHIPGTPYGGHQRASSTSTSTLPTTIPGIAGSPPLVSAPRSTSNYPTGTGAPASMDRTSTFASAPGQQATATQSTSLPSGQPQNSYAAASSFASPYGAADDFDDFDDLEEAKPDESDITGSGLQTTHSNASNVAVPDEWQQLFSTPAAPKPFSVGDVQASDVNELTSMGFSAEAATDALRKHKNNLSEATNYLLDRA